MCSITVYSNNTVNRSFHVFVYRLLRRFYLRVYEYVGGSERGDDEQRKPTRRVSHNDALATIQCFQSKLQYNEFDNIRECIDEAITSSEP